MDRREPGQPGVQGQQQVEALRGSHLADDEAAGSHAQRLLDQRAQVDLPVALEARWAALQLDPVGMGDLQLVDLLGRDDALVPRDRAGQAVEQRRLGEYSLMSPHDSYGDVPAHLTRPLGAKHRAGAPA